MSDPDLRELERRFRETGAVCDEAAWLVGRIRVGDLTRERIERAEPFSEGARLALTSLKPVTLNVKGGKRRRRGRVTRRQKVQHVEPEGFDQLLAATEIEEHVRMAVAAVIAASDGLAPEPSNAHLVRELPMLLPRLVALVEVPVLAELDQIHRRASVRGGDLAECVRLACAAMSRTVHDPDGLHASVWDDARNALAVGARTVGDQTEAAFVERIRPIMARWLLEGDPLGR